MPIDGDGRQYDMDATVAFKQAALNAIDYLMKVRSLALVKLMFGGHA